jgi:hypothetical protein
MAKFGSASFSVFLVGGYNMLAAKVKGITHKVESVMERTDGLGDAWETPEPVGMARATFAQEGAFFDDATNEMHDGLKADTGTARVGMVGHAGNVLGAAFTGFSGLLASGYEVLAKLGGLTNANATYSVSGAVEEGVILQPHATLTETTTGTSVDHGAATEAGGAGYLAVSAYADFTNIACKVRHSADDETYADLVTFATVTAGPTAQRVAVTGTVNRHLLSTVTVSGTGSAAVCIGFARGE